MEAISKMQHQLLGLVFQDEKLREIIHTSVFGDIIFKVNNGKGETYKLLQIYKCNNNTDEVYRIYFDLHILCETKNEFEQFILNKLLSHNELFIELVQRYELYFELSRLNVKPADFFYLAKQSSVEASEVLNGVDFYNKVIKECSFGEKIIDDLVDHFETKKLKDKNLFYVQKILFGHGFDRDASVYDCINLKYLAVWNESADFLDENIIKLQTLSYLSVTSTYKQLSSSFLDNIHKLTYLVSLTLGSDDFNSNDFQLSILPKKLDKLKHLKYLHLDGNKITAFTEIKNLRFLKTLSIVNNSITSLNGVKSLNALEELDVTNNSITSLPEELRNLKNLKRLNLSKNPLKQLPDWICELTTLQELNLEQTQLETLPKNIDQLKNLKKIYLKKNPFLLLPTTLQKLPKKAVDIEMRNKALYDNKAKEKLKHYPKGNCLFSSDINFKLMVIQKLMYEDEVLLPKFDVWAYAKQHKIDIESVGYDIILEALNYFKNLEIPMDLLIDIEELLTDGGDEIYSQIIPFWDGECETFSVSSLEDLGYVSRLKRTNNMNFSKELVKELRSKKIKVSSY